EVVKATGCYPDSIFSKANTNYNSSRSNVANTMAFITPDTTGIQEIIEKNLHINIYPNPNKGIFTIDINISKRNEFVKMPIKISVYNLLGKKVYGEEIQSLGEIHKHYLNLSNLPKGIYNIQLMNDEMKQVRKVVIH
ncbi:MAG: T9SS type A sorting domain-containing protein, partial [Saprospiraceae bacterium]|nr:T9SS type A sorting domain-containing protein [Saprospiraceae bacterium]